MSTTTKRDELMRRLWALGMGGGNVRENARETTDLILFLVAPEAYLEELTTEACDAEG